MFSHENSIKPPFLQRHLGLNSGNGAYAALTAMVLGLYALVELNASLIEGPAYDATGASLGIGLIAAQGVGIGLAIVPSKSSTRLFFLLVLPLISLGSAYWLISQLVAAFIPFTNYASGLLFIAGLSVAWWYPLRVEEEFWAERAVAHMLRKKRRKIRRGESRIPRRKSLYGSVEDLPQARAMQGKLRRRRWFVFFASESDANERSLCERELRNLTHDVEKFYDQLGSRNWVFHEGLSAIVTDEVIAAETADRAQQELVNYYRTSTSVQDLLASLKNIPEAHGRAHLIDAAYLDFQEDRHYSTVLLLITVINGIAHDVDKRNLGAVHAHHETVPLHIVMSRHLGLSNAVRTFNKDVKSVNGAAVTDVVRNGIVRGMTVNYNNEVVAAKSFNLLFSVADWSRLLRQEQGKRWSSI